MRTLLDIFIILGMFPVVRTGAKSIKALNIETKWKNPLTFILGAAITPLLLLLNKQGPFAKGVYIILIIFFVYTAYLAETHFPSKSKKQ